MSKIYYKLTNKNNGSLIVPSESNYYTKYIKGEFVEAPIGGLLVYSSFDTAYNTFKNSSLTRYLKLWEVEVEDEVNIGHYRLDVGRPKFDEDVLSYWTSCYTANYFSRWYLFRWPADTKAFKRVKLVRLLAEN